VGGKPAVASGGDELRRRKKNKLARKGEKKKFRGRLRFGNITFSVGRRGVLWVGVLFCLEGTMFFSTLGCREGGFFARPKGRGWDGGGLEGSYLGNPTRGFRTLYMD